ncbi:MAG: isocitrate/isopropylmalate dehydrogenase family protein [Thermoprotei archaeon]
MSSHPSSKKWRVAVLPGDGVGPDVVKATVPVLEAVEDSVKGLRFDLEYADAGFHCIEKYGTNLPKEAVDVLKRCECAIKGPMTTPEEPGSPRSVAVQIRTMFDLYANVRPAKTLPNVPSLKPNVDMIIVRENTEGMYAGLEFKVGDDAAVGIRVITRKASRRIGLYSLKLAQERRKRLTVVHKANILKLSDGLFLREILECAREFPSVKVDDAHVDAMTQWFIKQPEEYDVLVAENMFGDIISDEAAMVVGGLGVAPGANIGDNYAMFEPIHGSVPKYAGMDKVNPTATILSVKMMLDWMNRHDAAQLVQKAVEDVLREHKVVTYDLGGSAKCSEMGAEIARKIRKG